MLADYKSRLFYTKTESNTNKSGHDTETTFLLSLKIFKLSKFSLTADSAWCNFVWIQLRGREDNFFSLNCEKMREFYLCFWDWKWENFDSEGGKDLGGMSYEFIFLLMFQFINFYFHLKFEILNAFWNFKFFSNL